MRILIPTALHSYTKKSWVEANGATLQALLTDLDQHYPGIRFRMLDEQEQIRPHIRFFINGDQTFDLTCPLHPTDEVLIVQALSGG